MARALQQLALLILIAIIFCAVLVLLGPRPGVLFMTPRLYLYAGPPILLGVLAPRLLLALSPEPSTWRSSIGQALALGALCFLLMFLLLTRLYASAIVENVTVPSNSSTLVYTPETYSQHQAVVTNELWRYLSIPPALRSTCTAADSFVCSLAEQAQAAYGAGDGRSAYSWVVFLSGALAVTSAALLFLYKRPVTQAVDT